MPLPPPHPLDGAVAVAWLVVVRPLFNVLVVLPVTLIGLGMRLLARNDPPPPALSAGRVTALTAAAGERSVLQGRRGRALEVVARGDKGRPLVVLLHGFPDTLTVWSGQLAALADAGYYAVALSLRGYGATHAPKGVTPYAMEACTEDVEDVIRALGYDRARAVVGHDWGAVLAWTTAALLPELMERLVVLNGPHPKAFADNMCLAQARASWYMGFFQGVFFPEDMMARNSARAVGRAVLGGDRDPSQLKKDAADLARLGFMQQGVPTRAINYYRAAILAPPRVNTLLRMQAKVKVNTLVLWGTKDFALMESNLDNMADYVETSEVHKMAGGHWIMLDRPDEVNARMVEFLSHGAE